MAPHAAAASLKLWVKGLQGLPAGHEEELIAEMRSRLKCDADASLKTLTLVFAYGMAPMVLYLKTAIGTNNVDMYSDTELGDFRYDGFKIVAS